MEIAYLNSSQVGQLNPLFRTFPDIGVLNRVGVRKNTGWWYLTPSFLLMEM